MATRFAQQFARTGVASLLRQFGELITYYPAGGSTGREIMAIVERDVAVVSEIDGQVSKQTICRVENSATTGISSTEIDDGRDEVALPLKVGGTAERRQLTRKIGDANGFVRFMVR